jgi:gliding motility-associated-like protein
MLTMLTVQKTLAQYVQFIENKGQWNSKVKFQGTITGGSQFFLTQQGYQILLSDSNDIKKMADYYSGHDPNDKATISRRQDHFPEKQKNIAQQQPTFTVHSHAYQVSFVGSSANAFIQPDKYLNTYNNYFIGNDPSKWASRCKIFQAVLYKNIYPNIDIRYYTDNEGKLKYDFIVYPGGDASKIMLQFDGTDGLNINKNQLVIKTSVGNVIEMQPYAYQPGKSKQQVNAKYNLDGNKVNFKLGIYDRSSILVIDPALIFASFSGSIADNWGYTATYDNAGNFYAGGIAFSDFSYAVSPGAFQTVFGGGNGSDNAAANDIAIIKLDATGANRIYGTYLGGTGDESPHSMVVDGTGDLIVAGRTSSPNFPTNNIPKTVNTDPSGNSGFDIYITKFSYDGSAIVGSKIIGGSNDDGVNIRPKYNGGSGDESIRRNYGDDSRSEVIVDAANNIYLASCTRSMQDFPVTVGAFQTTASKGSQDAALIKLHPDLSVAFISYLGGNGDDAAFVLSLNPLNNNIYVGGATTSTDLQKTSGNAGPTLQSSYQGGACDGFVSIVSNDGSAQIKTCYVGNNGNDMVYGVQFDKLGFPYIMGTTTVAFPTINSPWNSSDAVGKLQASGKQFIIKMKPDLSGIIYSANFGTNTAAPNISPVAFLVDRCENVYMSGWGGGLAKAEGYTNAGTAGLSVTSDAILSRTDGSDFYFFVLEKDAASQLYGSFFGNLDLVPDVGDHVDGGTSRFDRQGIIYQAECSNCGRVGKFPVTSGAWNTGSPPGSGQSPAQGGSKCNEAAIKIAFQLAGVSAGVRTSINGLLRDTTGCIPLDVNFTDTMAMGRSYVWDFGDGSPMVTTTSPSTNHTYNNVGVYRVMLIAIDSSTCNIADTSYTHIRARANKAPTSFTFSKLAPCDSLKYLFTNTSTAPAGLPFSAQSFEWSFGDGTTQITGTSPVTHTYPSPGTYNVGLYMIDTTYCNYPDSATVQIRVAALVKAAFQTPAFGCAPYNAVFNNTSSGGEQFIWDFGDGVTSTETSPTHLYKTVGTYTITLIANDPQTCNKTDTTQFTITVSPKPIAGFTYSPIPPLENTPSTFNNNSTGATVYKWIFGDGDSLVTYTLDTLVQHIYNVTGTYTACLVAYNDYGCTDTVCQNVQAIVVPLVDVPNAFTPNGDGVNDFVKVKGYGIGKMDWKIYNRWGALVFWSTDIKSGWDGRYKGAMQPQEVYTYILDVIFTDGTKYRKTGDITLLK